MDNQEVIRLIRNLPTMCEFTDAYGEPIDSDYYYEAVDIAISALQAQGKCEDAVSRADVKEIVSFECGKWRGLAKTIIKKIEDMPSARPEIVRCKNCVNWIPGHITEHDDFIPPKCGKYQQMVGHSSDDYCSFAVRITDEEVD